MEPRFLQVTIKGILHSFPLLPASRIFPLKGQMTFFLLTQWLCPSPCRLCFCNTRNHPLLSVFLFQVPEFHTSPTWIFLLCSFFRLLILPLKVPTELGSLCLCLLLFPRPAVAPHPPPQLYLNAFLLSVAYKPSES